MKVLETDNLDEIISSEEKVMVQYGASWCGQCRMMKPRFQRLSNNTEDVSFYYVDAEKLPNTRKLAKVEFLPTFAAFKSGELVGQISGTKFEKVEALLNEITGS